MQQNAQATPRRDSTEPVSEQAHAPQTDPHLFGFPENIGSSTLDSLNSLFEIGLPLPTTDWAYFDGSL